MNRANDLNELLRLKRPAVAVRFQPAAPAGISRIEKTAASGCSYWKLAAEGRTFFTEAADHFGCPIGSHTHGIELPEDQATELEDLVSTMVGLQYITLEEVSDLPQLEKTFGVAVYAPLTDADFDPDVILVTGNARQLMLLAEAAQAAGIRSDASMVGRPTCAAIPAALQSGRTAANLGCVGNRVYTELGDDEFYFVIPGSHLDSIVDRLQTIVSANHQLEAFHRERALS